MASFKPVLKYIFPCVRLYCKLNGRDAQRNHVAGPADQYKNKHKNHNKRHAKQEIANISTKFI